jgi:DNA-binding winged helix-turn-helix (wHTH) protein
VSPTPSVVVQLNIAVPRDPAALAALSDLLHSLAELPGVEVERPAVAALPRTRPSPAETPEDGLRIVPHSRTVLHAGLAIPLTRLEFDLLLYLGERPAQVLPRDTLLAEVWGIDQPANSRTVDVHIKRLRDKLGTPGAWITTVRGIGYRFDGQDVVIEPAPRVIRRARVEPPAGSRPPRPKEVFVPGTG